MRKFNFLLLSFFWLAASHAQMTEKEESRARQLVASNAAAIGLTPADLNNYVVSSAYASANGLFMAYLYQSHKGIPVYNQMHVLAFRGDKVVSVAGGRISGLEKMVNNPAGIPSVQAGDAVRQALADASVPAARIPQNIPSPVLNAFRKLDFGKMGVSQENITAELFWYPVQEKEYRLVWQVFVAPDHSDDMWSVQVDAANGQVLGRYNHTVYCQWHKDETAATSCTSHHAAAGTAQDLARVTAAPAERLFRPVSSATYRVVKYPAESPQHPGGTPSLHVDPWTMAPGNATTLNWHNDGTLDHDSTRGNNVWAAEDRNNTNSVIDRAAVSQTPQPSLTFDYVPDFTQAPTTTTPPNQQFNITNLFYWNNIMHDITYLYGFDEPSGNFQNSNLGRGGAGNDYVIADAQDGGGTNNANFATPPDGTRPRMQMYLWTAPNPDRDGDVDNGIIAHEFAHGISNRLTGGPANASCVANAEHGGEGWSDYYGLMVTTDWSTATINDGPLPRPIGTYALNQPITGNGIRTFPYSTNLAVNPRVYSASLPTQVHARGEFWCAVLWEMTWAMIQQSGINPNLFNPAGTGGNSAALKLVTEGMKLQPCNPGFIDARNAILRADTLFFGAQYSCAIWGAFAKRGMGVGASQGSANSVTDQVPSFASNGAAMRLNNSAPTVPEGSTITFTNRVTADVCGSLTNFSITDTLPTHVTYVSGGTYNAANRVVTFSPVNLTAGQTQTFPLTVSVNPGSYFAPVTALNEPVAAATIPATWTPASTSSVVWTVSTTSSNSAPNAFFAPNSSTLQTDLQLATTNDITLNPVTASHYTTLSFMHRFNTEEGWDGGVVEISTNGGSSWSDLGSRMIVGGYNGSLGTGSNLSGRAAFTGTNGAGFQQTIVNLSSFAGQSIRIRFRFASDNNTAPAGGGWWVDDIVIYTEPAVQLRSSLFNAAGVRQSFSDTLSRITVGCIPLAITGQPVSVNACPGGNASFTVATSGPSPVYQWQVNTGSGFVTIPAGAPYSGENTATLTITGITAGMNGYQYRCLVSNSCTPATNTNAATLTVGSAAAITGQPASATVCPSTSTNFTVSATGAASYQWQVNTGSGFTNLTNTAPYSGVTTATLTINPVTSALQGYQYRCIIGSCAASLFSGAATLTVNAVPSVSAQPASQTICLGSNTSFSVTAAGTGISYQWQVNTGSGFVNVANGGVYSGATTSVLTVTGVTLPMNAAVYRCVVSGTCTPSVTSQDATLIVHAPVNVTSSPQNSEVCSGSDISFTAAGSSVPAIIYQWQQSTDGGATWTNITGATNATFTLTNVPASISGNRYRCLMSNATCPTPVASAAALLTVRQLPVVSLAASPLTSLVPGQSTTLTATPSASTGGSLSLSWTLNGNPITVAGNTLPVNVTGNGAYQVTIREQWTGGLICSNTSSVVTITATASDRLFIFPSPNDGNFSVSFYNASGTTARRWIRVFDARGALVHAQQFTVAGLYTLIPVNLEKASRGIYMVVIGDVGGQRLAEGKVHIR